MPFRVVCTPLRTGPTCMFIHGRLVIPTHGSAAMRYVAAGQATHSKGLGRGLVEPPLRATPEVLAIGGWGWPGSPTSGGTL